MRLLLSLAAVSLLAAGCISSNNGGSPGEDSGVPLEDSGTPPSEDATVPVDSSVTDSSVADAPVPDTGVDAADAAPPPVTMLVTNDLGPEPGVLVVFHDATGAVLGTATTGANGMVTEQLAANSQVTAFLQGVNGIALVTIQGVQPGDALTAFDDMNPAYAASTIDIDSLPDGGPVEAGTFYAYAGSCESSSSTTPFSVTGVEYPCELGGKYPLLVTANVTSTGQELAYTYERGGALPDGGGSTEVSVATPWASDEGTPAVSVANAATNPTISYGELSGDVVRSQGPSSQGQNADGGWSAAFIGHTSYPDAIQTEATVDQDLSDFLYSAYQAIATRAGLPDASATSGFDLSQALPQITASSIDATDAGTSNRPAITWTSTGSLATADGIIVQTNFTLTSADGGSSSNMVWRIVAPPSATSVTPPALPATLGTPAAYTGQYVVPVVIAVEASFFAGYTQVREGFAALTPSQRVVNDNGGPIAPTLPVDGTLRLSAVTQAGD